MKYRLHHRIGRCGLIVTVARCHFWNCLCHRTHHRRHRVFNDSIRPLSSVCAVDVVWITTNHHNFCERFHLDFIDKVIVNFIVLTSVSGYVILCAPTRCAHDDRPGNLVRVVTICRRCRHHLCLRFRHRRPIYTASLLASQDDSTNPRLTGRLGTPSAIMGSLSVSL